AWAVVLAGGLGAVLWIGHGVTDLGHLSAFLIGLGCYPVVVFRPRRRHLPAGPAGGSGLMVPTQTAASPGDPVNAWWKRVR
ncbi:MAG: hypothetical protein J2P19_25125, partial [Pseudonocardia sp.]|nr:hypothetical protein [Pseudonocardia sp.]